jgi:hypothetical protein
MSSLIFSESVYCIPCATDLSRGHYPHVDLRIDPKRIDEIEELKNEPLLKRLVALLNYQHGRLMTHGSAVSLNRPGVGEPEVPLPAESMGASCWKSSYVNVSFVVFDQNTERNYGSEVNVCPFSFCASVLWLVPASLVSGVARRWRCLA